MHDPAQERIAVPMSTGIPRGITWAGAIGTVLIFVVAAMVLATAGHGHLWPADRTLDLKF